VEGKLHILHLEDEPNDMELVREVLLVTGIGCEIEWVSTRQAFLAAVERGDVDLVLSDFSLPGFNGLAALRIIRERAPDLPFIFVSGTLGEEAAIEGVRSGATDYVLKHRLSRLEPAVRRALGESEERRKRRQAEEALVQERGFLKALLENLDAGIVACDAGGVLTLFNQATREIHGLPELPLPADDWAAHYDLYLADGKTRMEKEQIPLFRALHGERLRNVEMTVIPRNGSPRHVLASGQPIVDASGRKLGAVVALNDVTGRKQLEEQYRQAQKLEAIGRLAGGVAHDFNNLLSVILGYGDLCLQSGPVDELLRERIEHIRSAAQRAVTLTRQLLTFSRKQVVELQVVELNGLLGETTRMLRCLIGEDVQIVVRLAEGLGRIQADPGQIEQIVMNLAVNARDAMPQGGTLTLETANVDLDDAYADRHPGAHAGPHARLAITDTGVGMDAEILARIFEPFFTTKEQGKGTGLGLATVYGIVQQSGGHIEVESAPGRGTSFQVYLPCVDAPAASADRPEAAVVLHGTETIVVVEDEDAVRDLVLETLEVYGYNAIGAADASEAIGISERYGGAIQLLMTDIVLPGMSGRDLARHLTARFADLKVLYTSGYAGEAEPAFIQKPFALTALARKIREVLDGPPGDVGQIEGDPVVTSEERG